jgi:hypothetical protein
LVRGDFGEEVIEMPKVHGAHAVAMATGGPFQTRSQENSPMHAVLGIEGAAAMFRHQ